MVGIFYKFLQWHLPSSLLNEINAIQLIQINSEVWKYLLEYQSNFALSFTFADKRINHELIIFFFHKNVSIFAPLPLTHSNFSLSQSFGWKSLNHIFSYYDYNYYYIHLPFLSFLFKSLNLLLLSPISNLTD